MQSQIRYNLLLKGLNHGLVFLINILLVRALGASVSGIFFNDLYCLSALAFLGSLGLDYTVIASIASSPNSFSFWVKKIGQFAFLILPILFGLIFSLVHFKIITSQHLTVAVIFTFGQLLSILFQGLMSAIKAFKIQNYILLSTNLLLLFYLVLITYNINQIQISSLYLALAITIFSQGIAIGLAAFLVKKTKEKPSNSELFNGLKHGVVVMISTVIYFFFIRVDGFFVEQITDPKSLSIYVQCGKVGQYLLLFASLVSSSFIPFISEENEYHPKKDWQKIISPYFYILFLMALLIFFTGKWVFPWLFGSDFNDMYKLMNILLPGYLALGCLTLLNAFYIGKKMIRRMLIGDVLGLSLILSLNILLYSFKNVEWIATASSFSYFLLFLFMGIGIRKRLGLSK
jgi:O-antigen/teichoic acid export membrane protein